MRMIACARQRAYLVLGAVASAAALLALAGASAFGSTSDAGPVAAYSFDEAGSTIADASGNGNDGSLDRAGRTSDGRFGGALTFDGNDDWATIPDSSDLDLRYRMTLEAWVKPTSLGDSWRTVLVKEQTSALSYGLYADSGGRGPSVNIFLDGRETYVRTDPSLPEDEWSYVAATYDGSQLRVYVNGDEVASAWRDGPMATGSGALRIGGSSIWDDWFEGSIDEVRIYDRALSADEIADDMDTPIAAAAPPVEEEPEPDTTPPSTPTGLESTGSSRTSISVSWSPSTDDVGVTAYDVYLDGTKVDSTDGTGYTVSGLDCGTSHEIGVDAVDAAGNTSPAASGTFTTDRCWRPSRDRRAPTTPGSPTVSAATATAVTLGWTESTDDVAVAGYGHYRNGTLISNGSDTTYTFSGLDCGTSYTFAVDAYDAAGNRSAKASVNAATAACSGDGGGGGGDGGGGDTGGSGSSANLWVDGNGGSCTRQSSVGSYSDGAACSSFDAANDVCRAGDVVLVKGGSYGSQSLSGSNGRSGECTIREAPGETVTTSGLSFGSAAYVAVEGVTVTGGTSSRPKTIGLGGGGSTVASHIAIRNVSAYPGRLFIKGSYITVQGGEFGGYDACQTGSEDDGIQIGYYERASDHVVIDGINLHDVRRTCGSTHTDCIQFLGAQDSVVRNSHITNCPTTGIIARPQGGGNVLDGLTLENNVIGPVRDGSESYNIGTSPDNCTNILIRYNTFVDGGSIDCVTTTGNVFRGNVVEGYASCSDASYSYNAWTQGSCSSTGRTCTPRFVDASRGDYHLSSSDTCARAHGDPQHYPAEDADGDPRPQGTVDLGADEIP